MLCALAAEAHLTSPRLTVRFGLFLDFASFSLGPRAIHLALLLVGLLLESLRGLLGIARWGFAFLVVGSLLFIHGLRRCRGHARAQLSRGRSCQRTSMIQNTPWSSSHTVPSMTGRRFSRYTPRAIGARTLKRNSPTSPGATVGVNVVAIRSSHSQSAAIPSRYGSLSSRFRPRFA